MDELDYIEQADRANLAHSLDGLTLASARAYALLTLLLAGAGGAGGVAWRVVFLKLSA